MRQKIKINLKNILEGTEKIVFVPSFRKHLKESGLLKYKCECGISNIYNNKPIELDLDHIDGDKSNNTRDNLRWLCPNCHSQTITWKNKNCKKITKINSIKEIELVNSIKKGGSISDILKRVGLRRGGANYERIYNVALKYNIKLRDSGQGSSQ